FWEEEPCVDECGGGTDFVGCSSDFATIFLRGCSDSDGDGCLEYVYEEEACGDVGDNWECREWTDGCAFVTSCTDECSVDRYSCTGDYSYVESCDNFDSDECTEYGAKVLVENCRESDMTCSDGEGCVEIPKFRLDCRGRADLTAYCFFISSCESEGYDEGIQSDEAANCGLGATSYLCWNNIYHTTECLANATCPFEYLEETSRTSC
ncbi:MAG: hypothetical protein MI922_04210, partial [Bacteroidales bacterium]|nr:hypothetical protein [Bacteroidales bacterium]